MDKNYDVLQLNTGLYWTNAFLWHKKTMENLRKIRSYSSLEKTSGLVSAGMILLLSRVLCWPSGKIIQIPPAAVFCRLWVTWRKTWIDKLFSWKPVENITISLMEWEFYFCANGNMMVLRIEIMENDRASCSYIITFCRVWEEIRGQYMLDEW